MNIVIHLADFVRGLPVSTLIAIVIFFVVVKLFGKAIVRGLTSALAWYGINFIATAFFGIKLPTFTQMFNWVVSLFR